MALISLGCPKNQVDSELILGQLLGQGAEFVEDTGQADILVINTCSFIDKARAESVETLLEAARWKEQAPGRQVVAAGCLVQRSAPELARELPEIDGFIGLDEIRVAGSKIQGAPEPSRKRLPVLPAPSPARELFSAIDPRRRLSPPWTAYVKIAEGCDQNCSFCAIPSFRGRMRSRPVEDLLREITALASEGVLEVNLVAQDSSSYGRDLGLSEGLGELIRRIDDLDDAPPWVRIHYLYPGRVSPRLLEAMAASRRLVPYIDLPLQHADREILRRMARPGNAESYLRQIERLREALPGAALRSAFIVGFPGETEEHFGKLLEFVEQAQFDSIGVFTYSHEEGTGALSLVDDIPEAVKQERRRLLEELGDAVSHQLNQDRVGKRLEVLTEGPAEDRPECSSARWAGQAPDVDGRVLVVGGGGLEAGKLVEVEVSEAAPHELSARPVSEARRLSDDPS